MASTSGGIQYPVAGDFIAPLNAHLQTLAETTQTALNNVYTNTQTDNDSLHTTVTNELNARVPTSYISYSPTFTNLTLGNGTVDARYIEIGGLVVDYIFITLGTTSSITGSVTIGGMPASATSSVLVPVGIAKYNDVGNASYQGYVNLASTTSISLFIANVASTYPTETNVNATIPFTWGSGDRIGITTVRLAAL